MLKINRKLEYALISLKYLINLKPGQRASANEICETFHIPFDPTSRVLQIMVKKNLLRSEHGTLGGYQISKDLSKVSFLELSEMILGKTALARCISGKSCSHQKKCNIVTPVNKIHQQIVHLLSQLNLQHILEQQENLENPIEAAIHG